MQMMDTLVDTVSSRSIVVVVIVFFGAYWLYSRVIQPYREYSRYKNIVSPLYKTKVNPFYVVGTAQLRNQKTNIEKYGDSQYNIKYDYRNYQVILNSLNGKIFIDLIDPFLIRQFYDRTLQGCYVKFVDFPFFSGLKQIIGNGLVLSEGPSWKRKRKIMSSVFNFDFLQRKVGTISQICTAALDQLQSEPQNVGSQKITVDVLNLLQKIFGNVVIRCFFGQIQLGSIGGEPIFIFINNLLEKNTKRSMNVAAFLLGKNFHKWKLRKIDRQIAKGIQQFDDYAKNIIEQLIKKMKNPAAFSQSKDISGVIELLIKSDKLTKEEGKKEDGNDFYSEKELIDEFKTFFMAGTDTTANNTTILIYQLAKHPDVLRRVKEEIEQKIGRRFGSLTFEDLKKLQYLERVQKETLRMYGPSAGIFLREAVKDHFIGSIPVKKGVLVSLKIKSNHFKEEFYAHPEVFNPDRWEGIDSAKVDPFSFFPFSSGLRNCIGQHLALLQSKLAVVAILLRYKGITLEKQEFRLYMRTLYGAEKMKTTFTK